MQQCRDVAAVQSCLQLQLLLLLPITIASHVLLGPYLPVADPENAGRHIMMMKGAPERILDRCTRFLYNGR